MTQLSVAPTRDVSTAWIEMLAPAAELANAVGNTEFIPRGLRGNTAAITAAILTGIELHVGPMTALSQIAVIEGKPTLYAALMRALVLDRGHALWFEELTSTKVVCAGHRRGEQEVTRVTWTIQRARDANLAGKATWKQHPETMLAARASAELCRLIFADCLAGLVHAVEEVEDGVVDGAAPGGDAPTSRTTRRRPQRLEATVIDGATAPPPERPPLPGEQATNGGSGATGGSAPSDTAAPPAQQSASMKRMHSMFRQVGVESREDRLAVTKLILDRAVETSKDLSEEEMDQVSARLVDVVEKRVELKKVGATWNIA